MPASALRGSKNRTSAVVKGLQNFSQVLSPTNAQSFDVEEMFQVELDLIPERVGLPAEGSPPLLNSSRFFDEALEFRDKVLIILVCELVDHLDLQHLAAVLFSEFDCNKCPLSRF